ncbi:MerR family DNA-binding transcriptional regulator [Cobetia amphilecti]|jgi:DNA-binding transcriptional MerR regulator|uniref:MerR family transcriptional regulator n=1 Tax=Cobetia TaxID=204286 RepID=UPI002942999F|nr:MULTISPECIES: MerR family DNA-binding transcriptional regulator [Cobetia]WOI25249.1 MerR family DNA-binding transcriptional regulator [Cobetia amphilecti]|tara:strand:+ start:292 stop:813 length:522 start_codon:yes stop_codon:yes gene_type:complete
MTDTMMTPSPDPKSRATPDGATHDTGVESLLSTTSTSDAIRPTQRTWSIGELARHFDVTTRTIRFYEQEGLLHPERRGQTRVYRDKDRVRLKLTLRGKRLGFSLAEIREVVDLYDAADGGGEKQLTRLLGILSEKREGLERQLRDLTAMQRELDDVETRAREALARLAGDSES